MKTYSSLVKEGRIEAMSDKRKKILIKKKPSTLTKNIQNKSNYQSLEDATGILPYLVADVIVDQEVLRVLPKRYKDREDLIEYLAARLVRTYDNNESFAKTLKKSNGIDYAYTFMRHWASAYIKKNWSEQEQRQLGDDFANGKEIKIEASDNYNTSDSYWITNEGKIITTTDHERTSYKHAKSINKEIELDKWCNKTSGTAVNYAVEVWGWIRIMGNARNNYIAVMFGEKSVSPKAFKKFVEFLNNIPFVGSFVDISKDGDAKVTQEVKRVEKLKSLTKLNTKQGNIEAMIKTSGKLLKVDYKKFEASAVPSIPLKQKTEYYISKFSDFIIMEWRSNSNESASHEEIYATVRITNEEYDKLMKLQEGKSILLSNSSSRIKKVVSRRKDRFVFTITNGNYEPENYYAKVSDFKGKKLEAMNEIEASDKAIEEDYKKFRAEVKIVYPELLKKQHSGDVLADNYFTARTGKATDKEARQFTVKILQAYNKVPPGQLDSQSDIPSDLLKQLQKYQRIGKNKSKEYIKQREEGPHNEMKDLELYSSDTYTNKSKSVKLIYYANRSTPQTCKPGQTVKAKAGYGKRTKIKTATPEQVRQLKAGKWVRDREDGKKANDPKSKTSKYRPQLANKQKAARKKLAASEGVNYKDFLNEVFDK